MQIVDFLLNLGQGYQWVIFRYGLDEQLSFGLISSMTFLWAIVAVLVFLGGTREHILALLG